MVFQINRVFGGISPLDTHFGLLIGPVERKTELKITKHEIKTA